MHISNTKHHSRRAFTLIELLTVFAIIGILAAILIPAISAIKKSANNSICVSNLRQVGAALSLYAGDHRGQLPGPINSGVSPELRLGESSELVYHLQPYLSLPRPSASPHHSDLLRCQAAEGLLPSTGDSPGDAVTYATYEPEHLPASMQYFKVRENNAGPFGLAADSETGTEVAPLTLQNLAANLDESKRTPRGGLVTLAEVPAIRDIDASQKSWPWTVPVSPSHENHVNVLYFDWHVGSSEVALFRM